MSSYDYLKMKTKMAPITATLAWRRENKRGSGVEERKRIDYLALTGDVFW